MRVRPRQQLLDIWEATLRCSWREGQWVPGGRSGSNAISDAEQILCILLPATQVETFSLDRPDQTDERMVHALRRLGTATDIPRVLVQILTDYYERYTQDGAPVFSGGGGYEQWGKDEPPAAERTALPIVDSFALSITLSLATLGFVQVFRRSVTRADMRERIAHLETAASTRLTAAMVGLLRSFSVNVFTVDSLEGQRLCRTVNQGEFPRRVVVSQFHSRLRQTVTSFREVLIGSGQTSDSDLELPDRLFECGWSWSVVNGAPVVETTEKIGEQPTGVAADRPHLYFTAVALHAAEDLFSERTRVLGLLNEEQQRLARALQLRSDLTRTYWATVATFGDDARWPLESIPWTTTGGEQSDYFTLQVASLAVQSLAQVRGSDVELARVARVLGTLADRGRITSRAFEDDPQVGLHVPGVRLALAGSGGPEGDEQPLVWPVPDFATLLLTRVVELAALSNDAGERAAMLNLGDEIWAHLERRRAVHGDWRDLWDQPERLFPAVGATPSAPSWYHTERVVAALVALARLLDQPPSRNVSLAGHADELIREAEQIFDRELLGGGLEAGPQLRESLRRVDLLLRRAKAMLAERPGTAATLAIDILRELDKLAVARDSARDEA